MNGIFLISVILKGLGAILEVLLQMMITGTLGVEGYGTYSAWINAADLIFWIFLSGIVKCNTFYLSGQKAPIHQFKRKFYCIYALPLLTLLAVLIPAASGIWEYILIPVITGLELMVLDNSSTLLAHGKAKVSLIGEYVLGRFLLITGVLATRFAGVLNLPILVTLYIIQYLAVLIFFSVYVRKNVQASHDISRTVSISKLGAYQKSDLMHSMIEQMPVVAQYAFSGAFEAGVVSIVLLVKKLINFVSGPTAKVFLPEFSRLYHAGDKAGIRGCYHAIMRIQMLIVGPMAVVLLGYPGVVLRILADELIEYKRLFMICSCIFLLTASLGPCGGILQMTGNEKPDNRCREYALLAMVVIMVLTRKDAYFVLYGLCTQVGLEAVGKYSYMCRWMAKSPVTLLRYLSWWLLPVLMICITLIFKLQESFLAMLISAGAVFCIGLVRELCGDNAMRTLTKLKEK